MILSLVVCGDKHRGGVEAPFFAETHIKRSHARSIFLNVGRRYPQFYAIALNKHDPRLQVLIRQAAADVRRLNPHIGAAQQPEEEAQYAEMERERQELERIWAEMERQRGGSLKDEPAAQAVDEDRGE